MNKSGAFISSPSLELKWAPFFTFREDYQMVGVIIGAVVLLADAVFLYCCLRIGSEADRQMREELEKNENE